MAADRPQQSDQQPSGFLDTTFGDTISHVFGSVVSELPLCHIPESPHQLGTERC